jgi:hypothetical protein
MVHLLLKGGEGEREEITETSHRCRTKGECLLVVGSNLHPETRNTAWYPCE